MLTRMFMIEFWPALIIVVFRPVRNWPGIVLTLYGWILVGKAVVSLPRPEWAPKSMDLARREAAGFVPAGVALIAFGTFSGRLALTR